MIPTDPGLPETGGSTGRGPLAPAVGALPQSKHEQRRLFWSVVIRVFATTFMLLLIYFLLPIGSGRTAVGVVVLCGAIALLLAVTVYQLRRILTAEHPQLRAVEAAATLFPLFIVVFAYVYVWMSKSHPASFTQPIGRMDGLYFVVTVFTTTGFGDITARTTGARAVVTIQMLLDLVYIGVVIKLMIGASRIGLRHRQAEVSTVQHSTPSETET